MAEVDVFFEKIHDQIVYYINHAKKSIKIAVAWFTDFELYNAITSAAQRGCTVSLIIANHTINKNQKIDFKELLSYGGSVGYIGENKDSKTTKLMHNKFCIIDDQVIINGSCNWTYKARINNENVMIIKNSSNLVTKFNSQFDLINPPFGFTIKENQVIVQTIQEIMSKWTKKQGKAIPIKKETKNANNTDDIISKF